MVRFSWIFWISLISNDKWAHRENIWQLEEEMWCEDGNRDWSDVIPTQRTPGMLRQTLEAGRGKGTSLLKPTMSEWLCLHLEFGLFSITN